MAHDGVPWFTGGGAEHSPAIARMLPYILLNGAEGVVRATDCRCLAMPVPSNRIRVMPGSYAILNRALGGESQMYLGRVTSQDEVETTPTGSSGPRSDLVIIRVENPHESGENWQMPADVANGPYVFTRIIEGVPANTINVKQLNLGYSAIAIARIDIPASTSTITQAMIKDLRPVARQGVGELLDENTITSLNWRTTYKTATDHKFLSSAAYNSYITWPNAMSNMQFPIPSDCTSFDFIINLANIQHDFESVWADMRLESTDGTLVSNTCMIDYNKFIADQFLNGGVRVNAIISGTVQVPPDKRGKKVGMKLTIKSRYNNTGVLWFNQSAIGIVDVVFKQATALA